MKKEIENMQLKLIDYIDKNLPKGFTPYYLFSIVVDEKEVGRITLRKGSRQEHYFDGHIGYHIEPEYRGHHYAGQACLLLQEMMGFQEVILTCDPDNVASLKTIQGLGAVFLERKVIPIKQRRFFSHDEKEKMIFLWKATEKIEG